MPGNSISAKVPSLDDSSSVIVACGLSNAAWTFRCILINKTLHCFSESDEIFIYFSSYRKLHPIILYKQQEIRKIRHE